MNEENVFKLLSVRPPQLASDEAIETSFISLQEPVSAVLKKIKQLKTNLEKQKFARSFIDSNDYILNITGFKKLSTIASQIRDLSANAGTEPAFEQLLDSIQNLLGQSIPAFISNADFKKNKLGAWDSYLCKILLFKDRPHEREKLLALIRMFHLLETFNDDKINNEKKNLTFRSFKKLVALIPREVLSDETKVKATAKLKVTGINQEEEKKIKKLTQDIKEVEEMLSELRTLFNKKLVTAPKELPDDEDGESDEEEPGKVAKSAAPHLNAGTENAWGFDTGDLPKNVQTALLKHNLVWIGIDAPSLIHKTEKTIAVKKLELQTLLNTAKPEKIVYKNVVIETNPDFDPQLSADIPEETDDAAGMSGARPLGVGDLLVIKQKLLRYEAGEIAHIENVMKSEHRERKHRRLNRQEQILYVEKENQKESERDLQSTERFELQSETSKTLESESKFDAGVKVNYYGFVDVEAYANYASENSSSEANKNATNFAKDVTERSVSKILERTKEERTTKTFQEIEEINDHGFDNQEGDAHINGIYRWVDKIYEAQVYNYGIRLMYEFIIPEPGVFYLNSMLYNQNAGLGAIKQPPPRPTIMPAQIKREDYTALIAKYEVTDADAPPQQGIVISQMVDMPTNKDQIYVSKIKEAEIPSGYKAVSVKAFGTGGARGRPVNYHSRMYVASARPFQGQLDLLGVVDKLPIGFLTNSQVMVFPVTIYCELIPEVFEKWQLDTYTKIMNGYHKLVMDYEEKIASVQIRQGVQITGDNPLINRVTERNELKKQCISVFMKNRFEEMGSVYNTTGEFFFNKAAREGKLIQFFEQAFEWNNMTYSFYPYFWSRKSEWMNKMILEITDPIFNQFLKAGAVRVVVPVNPAYDDAVLYFQQTEDLPLEERIWNGGEPPVLEDPLFISIAEEIKAASELEENVFPVGEPWQIKLPTTLVWLQEEPGLPNFETES